MDLIGIKNESYDGCNDDAEFKLDGLEMRFGRNDKKGFEILFWKTTLNLKGPNSKFDVKIKCLGASNYDFGEQMFFESKMCICRAVDLLI